MSRSSPSQTPEGQRRYYRTHPKSRARRIAYNRAWRKKNVERWRASQHRCYLRRKKAGLT